MIERDWPSPGLAGRLADYARQTTAELLAAERLVAALYANMNDFELFKRLSLLYFAAASFSETARRLGKPELAPGFLLHDHPAFGPKARLCAERACGQRTPEQRMELLKQIDETIRPVDVAGLGDRTRRDWYPVEARDLFAAAPRLGVGEAEIRQLLMRCGFDRNSDGG
jgi:FADH2 O2-dependent halogenase